MKKTNQKLVNKKLVENDQLIYTAPSNLSGSINENAKQRLIVVLGMHRSGTSAITRSLTALDVNLGDTLYGTLPGVNDKGFWEDIDLNSLDVEMLAALGSDWHHLSAIQQNDIDILRNKGFFLRAVELLRKKINGMPVFGFKDPRVAKLLLFWKEVFKHCQYDISYVLALRHPLSVVKSLAKRNSFDAEKTYFLWLNHVITSLEWSRGSQRIVIDYDLLMQDPEYQLNRLAKQFDLNINSDELNIYKTEFLDKNLQHTVYRLEDLSLDESCPPLVHEVYAALLDLASDKGHIDDSEFQKKIEHWVSEFKRIKTLLNLTDRLSTQRNTAVLTISERDNQVSQLNQTIAERDSQFNQAVAERDNQIICLNQAIAERDKLISCLNQKVVERDNQISCLNQAIAKRDRIIVTKTNTIDEIFQSNTWRLLAPLRWCGKLRQRLSGFKKKQPSDRIGVGEKLLPLQAISQVATHPAPHYAPLFLPMKSDQLDIDSALPRVAVHIHVHYIDLLDELLEDASHLPGKADVFVTTTQSLEQIEAKVKSHFFQATVWQTENRGKDIGPFIDALQRYKLDEYDLVLKLHGKKSQNIQSYMDVVRSLFGADIRNGDDWRRSLIKPLTASKERVMQIYNEFALNQTLGMVGASRFICRAPDADQAGYEFLCRRLGIGTDVLFFGGTMFWIRGHHLHRLRKAGLTLQDFRIQGAESVENTLEHVCERIFGALVAADGGWVGGIE